jgi:hypothetical protein
MGFIGLPWARVERKTSAVATFSDLAGELGSGSTGGFPPTFTIAAPRSTEGEAMAKAGGKENIHAQESLGEQASVGAPMSRDIRFCREIATRSFAARSEQVYIGGQSLDPRP